MVKFSSPSHLGVMLPQVLVEMIRVLLRLRGNSQLRSYLFEIQSQT